ncbi:MAG: hypothetical protein FJ148_01555 [Deltaproteobacteria bacterium]|nr:hypothetical protein [Deltaproteobacteria bacterium]
MPGKWLVPVLAAAALVVACSGNKAFLNEKDPFDDPFFSDGLGSGTRSLDEIMREPAPSVGWLSRDGNVQSKPPPRGSGGTGVGDAPDGENVLLEAEDDGDVAASGDRVSGADGEEGEEGEMEPAGEKSTYDQASEATMATMSVLFGLGMAALPFLIGT